MRPSAFVLRLSQTAFFRGRLALAPVTQNRPKLNHALRREHSVTQVQLAEALSVSQQTMQSYEVGRRRIPVSALPAVAQTLSVSLDELFGEATKPARGRRGPVPQWQEQMEAIAKLPRARRNSPTSTLAGVLVA